MIRQRLLSLYVTLLLCLEKEFPGEQSTAALQRLAFTPSVQSGKALDSIQQEKLDVVELSCRQSKKVAHRVRMIPRYSYSLWLLSERDDK
ncbi:hypothetical protein TNCV_1666131 [Trichonephila clavipes]|nr:hypothetical protein TNCV_1666131 [Trichonephila clavipes]